MRESRASQQEKAWISIAETTWDSMPAGERLDLIEAMDPGDDPWWNRLDIEKILTQNFREIPATLSGYIMAYISLSSDNNPNFHKTHPSVQ